MKTRKLTRFLSMLVVAMMPGFISLEAAIVYSGPNQNVTYSRWDSPSAFSLFGKAAQWDDILLVADVHEFYDPYMPVEYRFGNLLDVHGNFIDFAFGASFWEIKRFDAGMTIDGMSTFSNNEYTLFSELKIFNDPGFYDPYSDPPVYYPGFSHVSDVGQFRNQTGYAGIRMVDGANTYYGWMQVSVENYDNSNITGTLIDWAYEDTPGRAIIAGETFSAPEPSGTLLAAAGIGLIMFRRRLKNNWNCSKC